MQDYLKDIVSHTNGLAIDLIKVFGDENAIKLNAIAADRSVVMEAKFKNTHPDFIGTYGMPNIGKLKTILGIDEYREDAKITVNTQKNAEGVDAPCGLHFENKNKDFKNDYRFMGANVLGKTSWFNGGVKWGVDFEPSVQSIQRLRFQAAANSEETTFTARTENGDLKFFFGDPNSHAGNFVFEAGVQGEFTRTQYHWPVNVVLAILALPGTKRFKMSDGGATVITIDSGLIDYSYILSAQTK